MDEFLDLEDITRGFPGLTKAWGVILMDGCIAALWFNEHNSELEFITTGSESRKFKLRYPEERKTQQLADSWADTLEATEKGAACIGILLALKLTNFQVVRRAVRFSGIDYWIGAADDGVLFQNKARLEVSGIFKGTNSEIEKRYDDKCNQTKQSDDSLLPAYVAITEFSKPVAKFGKRWI